jgi:TonB family protein
MPDVVIGPTLQPTRTQSLRTETARPFRSETALTENAAGNAVVRDPASAAPEFPSRLLATGVSGEVTARFVVDTLGVADVASYTVVRSTRGEFSDAVLRALPRMRFRPATQGGRLVRQWVEQTFYFRVQRNETALTKNEVDNPVERDPTSPEPEFPKELLTAGIAGQVTARFVVDTMGVVDMTSYTVVQFSRAEFEVAVRAALPGMRFTPATQGGRLVRQWVEQTFHFRIQRKTE